MVFTQCSLGVREVLTLIPLSFTGTRTCPSKYFSCTAQIYTAFKLHKLSNSPGANIKGCLTLKGSMPIPRDQGWGTKLYFVPCAGAWDKNY